MLLFARSTTDKSTRKIDETSNKYKIENANCGNSRVGGWELMRDEQWGVTEDNVRWMVGSDSARVLVAKSEGILRMDLRLMFHDFHVYKFTIDELFHPVQIHIYS